MTIGKDSGGAFGFRADLVLFGRLRRLRLNLEHLLVLQHGIPPYQLFHALAHEVTARDPGNQKAPGKQIDETRTKRYPSLGL